MLFHIYVCLVIDCSFVIMLCCNIFPSLVCVGCDLSSLGQSQNRLVVIPLLKCYFTFMYVWLLTVLL